jgi:hypothetical protein
MLFLVPFLLAAFPPAPQDLVSPGFQLEQHPHPSASVFAATARLSSGELVVFDGLSVGLYDPSGTLVRELGAFEEFVFPSFVAIDPAEERAVLGESSNGDLFEVALGASASPDLLVHLPFAYDAVHQDEEHLLVSAATCGFGCGNEIWRVTLPTRSLELVARVSGASGPLALDAAGNLLYATASAVFPPPPKPTRVLRWSAAQLALGLPLSEDDAELVGGGFAGAAGLAVDPEHGHVFLLENNFASGENRLRHVLGSADESATLVEGRPFFSMANLDFLQGDGRAAFLPYQPPTGGRLAWTTTDFVATVERFELVTRRPELSLSGPGLSGPGPFEVALDAGPPGGFARILYCPRSLYQPEESVIPFRGIPLFLGLDLATLSSVPGLIPCDAGGGFSRTFLNPGGYEGLFALQVLLLDERLRIVGTSSAAFL